MIIYNYVRPVMSDLSTVSNCTMYNQPSVEIQIYIQIYTIYTYIHIQIHIYDIYASNFICRNFHF